MASGTLTTSYKPNQYGDWTYRIYWSSTTDIVNNTSTVICDHWLVMNEYTSISIGARSNTCTVGTDTKSFTSPAINSKGTTTALGTTVHTVQHNADGTKSVELSSTFNVNATLAGAKQNSWTITATLTLDTIPRASTPTLSAYATEMGKPVTIYTNPASSSFRHKLYYNWYSTENGSPKWVNFAVGVEGSSIWTPLVTFANNLPGTTEGVGTIRCETYNGNTLIGTKEIPFKATVPSYMKPEVSVLIDEPTGYMGKYGALVQGRSTLQVKTQGIESYGSPIESYKVIVDGLTYQDTDITTKEVTGTDGLVTITVTATDERGRTSDPFVETFTILPYTAPVVTALSVHRCDADGTENDQGEYVQATFSANVTALNGANSATYTLRCAALASDMELTDLEGQHTVTNYAVEPFLADGNSTFVIEIEAADDFTEGNKTTSVSTAFTLMNCGPSGRSIAFGKVAEIEDTMEVALDLKLLGQLQLGDTTLADYVVETGTEAMGSNGTWYWTKWASGKAECYGIRNYGNMAVNTTWGSLYVSDMFTQTLPSGLFNSAPFVNIDIHSSNYTAWVAKGFTAGTTEKTNSFFVVVAGAVTMQQVHFGFHVIGRWK